MCIRTARRYVMKHLISIVTTSALVLFMAAGAFAIHELIPSETQIVMPGADAEKLNDYIVRYDPYKSWRLWPGKGRLYTGREPHGSLLTTFVNDNAHYGIRTRRALPDGSIIAKENYTKDREFVALTVMYKIKGYNPEAGDWFWVKYAPSGKVEVSGKVKACIDCHSTVKDNDYVFTGNVVK